MLANLNWYSELFAGLGDDTHTIQHLNDLKIAISALDNNQVKFLATSLPLNEVFDCLNSSDTEQVEVACDVVALLLSPLDINIIVRQYESMLRRSLNHPMTRVKEMVLKELDRATNDEASIIRLTQETELLASVTACIADAETSIGSAVSKLLVKLASTQAGLAAVYSQPGLKRAMEQNAVTRLRVYETVVNIAAASPSGLAASQQLLQSLLKELEGRDVLTQLSSIELITLLALTPHGLNYLESTGVVGKMARHLDEPDINAFLLPGVIKFFGNVAQVQPLEVFQRYPQFVSAIRNTVSSSDMVLANIAMETVGFVGSTLEGKCALDQLDDAMPALLRKLGENIATLQTEWRIRALNIVANLVQLKEGETNEALTQRWFSHISDRPMELIAGICRLPFPELRLAGLQVVQAICTQLWGQQTLNALPGSVEFLTDRSQEPNKLCLDAKFEIVKSLAESPHSAHVFSPDVMKNLREFVREGAYFVRPRTEVVVENMSV